MKILYAIQGTGNGHLSRARDIIPELKQKVDLDILISGTQADVHIPYEVKYRLHGLSFIFGKKGGVDLWQTFKKNNISRLIKEIKQLPLNEYDLIINDFEPVSAWSALLKNKPCIALSHQSAVLSENAPRPRVSDWVGAAILKYYAPAGEFYGFHFNRYNDCIFTPVIRKQVRELKVTRKGHYTVYLPAYDDQHIINVLSRLPGISWEIFSKHCKKAYQTGNIRVVPIQNEPFIQSMASSEGVLCGAGFETPAEALFLNKKLMVIPMKAQYEQQCNAVALKSMGIPVLKNLKSKRIPAIEHWIFHHQPVDVHYPDQTATIIENILEKFATQASAEPRLSWTKMLNLNHR